MGGGGDSVFIPVLNIPVLFIAFHEKFKVHGEFSAGNMFLFGNTRERKPKDSHN